jgi:hypothetical protein
LFECFMMVLVSIGPYTYLGVGKRSLWAFLFAGVGSHNTLFISTVLSHWISLNLRVKMIKFALFTSIGLFPRFGSLLTLLLAFISIVDTMIQVISYNIAKGSLNR